MEEPQKRRVYRDARTFSNTFFSKTQKDSKEKTRVTQRGKTGRVTTKRRGRRNRDLHKNLKPKKKPKERLLEEKGTTRL